MPRRAWEPKTTTTNLLHRVLFLTYKCFKIFTDFWFFTFGFLEFKITYCWRILIFLPVLFCFVWIMFKFQKSRPLLFTHRRPSSTECLLPHVCSIKPLTEALSSPILSMCLAHSSLCNPRIWILSGLPKNSWPQLLYLCKYYKIN